MKRTKYISIIIVLIFLITCTNVEAQSQNLDVIYNSVNMKVNEYYIRADNILYKGTTYAPLRAVAETLEKEVDWNQDTFTASINDTSNPKGIKKFLYPNTSGARINKNIDALFNSVKLEVNGENILADNILYNGTTYVPLRAVSEALGKYVLWEDKTNTAIISDVTEEEYYRDINSMENPAGLNKTIKAQSFSGDIVEITSLEMKKDKLGNYFDIIDTRNSSKFNSDSQVLVAKFKIKLLESNKGYYQVSANQFDIFDGNNNIYKNPYVFTIKNNDIYPALNKTIAVGEVTEGYTIYRLDKDINNAKLGFGYKLINSKLYSDVGAWFQVTD